GERRLVGRDRAGAVALGEPQLRLALRQRGVLRRRGAALREGRERGLHVVARELALGERGVGHGVGRLEADRAREVRLGLGEALLRGERAAQVVVDLEALDAAAEQLREVRDAHVVALLAQRDQALADQPVRRLEVLDLVLRIRAGLAALAGC